MTVELVTIPCRADNYAFLIRDSDTGLTAVIDVPDAAPIIAALKARTWTLSHILITHHHDDHIEGVEALREATDAKVCGSTADAHRLPRLDIALNNGDTIPFGADTLHVIGTPGHTVGHICYHLPASRLAFTADTLMAAGCGRLFEGTPAQMYASLARLAALPPETLICSGHEYTASNLRFAVSVDPDNPALVARIADTTTARAAGKATVPSLLSLEIATNPFLRAPSLAAFATLRAAKDRF